MVARYLAGELPFEGAVARLIELTWNAHTFGPLADEVAADLEALLVWRSEGVVDDQRFRAELAGLVERVARALDTEHPAAAMGH